MKQYLRMLRGIAVAIVVLWTIGYVVIAVKRGPAPPPGQPVEREIRLNAPSRPEEILNKMAGRHPDDPDPTATLVAPFADTGVQPVNPQERAMMRLPTNAVPLDQPHRSAEELGAWLMQGLSEILSFTAEDYNDHFKILARGINPQALGQLNDWVNSSGIMSTLQGNGLQLSGFVEETPFLLNEGVVDGRYRWLFEVPVQISFIPKGMTSLDHQNGISTRKLIVTLQLGRVDSSGLPDNIMVESWAVRDNTRTK